MRKELAERLSRKFRRERIKTLTTHDIEMAAAIESAINAFYITKHPRPKGIHLHSPSDNFSAPVNVSVSFGRHRIGREEINPDHHHLPSYHPKTFYYYDVQDMFDPNLRRGIQIEPTRVRYYSVLKNGETNLYDYSSDLTQGQIADLMGSFKSMPKKPGDLRPDPV